MENTSQKSDRRTKFIELAERRTANAIKAIRVISKLGNRAAYDYDETDVRKIAAALTREIEAMKLRMSPSGKRDTIDFKL
jgi:hypothetical protein